MKITYYGHSCFQVDLEGTKLLFDPFISGNEKAAHINIDELEADWILLSHGHQDHVADAARIAKNTGAKIISNYEIVSWYGQQDIGGHPLNHGGKWKFDFGTVKYVNAIHTSSLPDGSYGGNPGGFIVESQEGDFYFSGDTALTYDMKLIGESHRLEFAMLCIGDNFTMGVDDAVIAADYIRCEKIIGMHYDTFGYIVIDHEDAKRKFASKGKQLVLPEIGKAFKP